MFKLDNNFLTSLGLSSLPVDEKNKLLQHIYERLEMNVGMRLAEKMTDAQLDEFESFIDRNDEQGALRWLETNFPNYKQVVAEELEKLKQEVSQAAPQILAAAQEQGPSNPGQPAAAPPQPYQQAGPYAQPAVPAAPAPEQFPAAAQPFTPPVPQADPYNQPPPQFDPYNQPGPAAPPPPGFPPAAPPMQPGFGQPQPGPVPQPLPQDQFPPQQPPMGY